MEAFEGPQHSPPKLLQGPTTSFMHLQAIAAARLRPLAKKGPRWTTGHSSRLKASSAYPKAMARAWALSIGQCEQGIDGVEPKGAAGMWAVVLVLWLCVGVWACGCVGVWACGCVGVCVCVCVRVLVLVPICFRHGIGFHLVHQPPPGAGPCRAGRTLKREN